MNAKTDSDLSRSTERHAKAMVYRSHQGLKKELQNIDSERSKALSIIRRDLERTKDNLKALRMTQKQVRHLTCIIKHKQGMDFDSAPPIPDSQLRKAFSVPLESELSSKIVQRRRFSEVSAMQIILLPLHS